MKPLKARAAEQWRLPRPPATVRERVGARIVEDLIRAALSPQRRARDEHKPPRP
jgi:hypothetical protein